MKYIVIRHNGQELPVIFPNSLVHRQVYEGLRLSLIDACRRNGTGWAIECVSAGECVVSDVTCSGYSETLNLHTRGSLDEQLIQTHDYLHGL